MSPPRFGEAKPRVRERLDPVHGSHALKVAVFTLAIFVSAALLFSIQPLFAKMVLPLLGGAPAVWTTAMVFFQVTLLAGYGYAHVLGTLSNPIVKRVVHLLLIASALLVLPIAIDGDWSSPDTHAPTIWLLGLFAVSIGLPFFALSANAPLIQRWFSETDHPRAHDPYFLYAASNVGSIMALLAYPFVIEPALGLRQQSLVWSGGYLVLIALLWSCCLVRPAADTSSRARTAAFGNGGSVRDASARPSLARRAAWLVYAFVPSSLLLGVTTHLSTDVAAVPMVWIVPLVLFLLTFVNVFSERPWISHAVATRMHGLAVVALLAIYSFNSFVSVAFAFAVHLLAFFFSALVCHGELARRRPGPENLTEFYLWMSVGGALGGVFNAIVAPVAFTSITEYPLAVVAACALRPALAEGAKARPANDVALPSVLALVCLGVLTILRHAGLSEELRSVVVDLFILGAALFVYSFSIRPLRFAAGVAILMATTTVLQDQGRPLLHRERSFFGTHSVELDEASDSVILKHGTTLHGLQRNGSEFDDVPLSYYSEGGPVGQVFGALRREGSPVSAAVVGLGAGAIVCYKRPDERWKVFEIDPTVVRIASDPQYFRYLDSCGADVQIVLGDARLTLERERGAGFDVVVLDAFSSDSVPVNIVTQEALSLYLDVIGTEGLILAHVSNRYLDLERVFQAHARTMGLAVRRQAYEPDRSEEGVQPSRWILLAESEETIEALRLGDAWQALDEAEPIPSWTDDFSNVLDVFSW